MGEKLDEFMRSGIRLVEISGDQPDLPQKLMAKAKDVLPSANDPSGAVNMPVKKL